MLVGPKDAIPVGTMSPTQLPGSLKLFPAAGVIDHVASRAQTGLGTPFDAMTAIAMRAAYCDPRGKRRRNQVEQGLSDLVTSAGEPSARCLVPVLRRKQPRMEEKVQPSRKLLQGQQVWRSVSDSTPLFSRGWLGNAIRPPSSGRTEERETSRTVRGDVSNLQLHRFLSRLLFRHERPFYRPIPQTDEITLYTKHAIAMSVAELKCA